MPTILSHSAIAVAASSCFPSVHIRWKLVILSIVCSVLPDADVLGYIWFYVPYDAFFGHRGLLHSPVFAALLGLIVVVLFYRKETAPLHRRLWLYFFLLTASHGVLDAMTNGGQGICAAIAFQQRAVFSALAAHRGFAAGVRSLLKPAGAGGLAQRVFMDLDPLLLRLHFDDHH